MPFNLLLLPLIGGYYFFKEWDKTAFEAKRVDKERLLLQSAFYGILLLAVSFFASSLIPYSSILAGIREWWAYHTPPIAYSGISAFSLALGYYAPKVFNLFTKGDFRKVYEGVLEKYGSQLEQMLYSSLVDNKRVMVTLKNGKVYIGRVTISLRPQEDKDFILFPSLSGYRDEKQRLVITTNYDDTYTKIVDDNPDGYLDIIEDFGMVIPISEVVSASLYREEIHTKYFHHEDPPDALPRQLNPISNTTPIAKQQIQTEPEKVSE